MKCPNPEGRSLVLFIWEGIGDLLQKQFLENRNKNLAATGPKCSRVSVDLPMEEVPEGVADFQERANHTIPSCFKFQRVVRSMTFSVEML